MQKLSLILLVFTSVCAFIGQTQTQATPPPVNVGVINFTTRFTLAIALQRLRGVSLPEQTGTGPFPKTRWRFFEMTVTNTVFPSSSVVTRHPTILNRFTWVVRGGAITVGGRFTTKRRIIKRSGTFTATVSNIAITVDASRGFGQSVTLNRFQCSVGGLSVRFRGARTWLLNLFRRVIARRVRERVQTQACNAIRTQLIRNLPALAGK